MEPPKKSAAFFVVDLENSLLSFEEGIALKLPGRENLWTSVDGGSTWSEAKHSDSGLLACNERAFYQLEVSERGDNKLHRSLDRGENWTSSDISEAFEAPEGYSRAKGPKMPLSYQFLVDSKDRLLVFRQDLEFQTDAGTPMSGTLYSRSTDGQTWSNQFLGTLKMMTYDVATNHSRPDTVGLAMLEMARGVNPGQPVLVLLSNDGGETWAEPLKLSQDHSAIRDSVRFAMDGDFLVVAWRQQGKAFAFSSLNGGKTWSKAQELGPSQDTLELSVLKDKAVVATQIDDKVEIYTVQVKE